MRHETAHPLRKAVILFAHGSRDPLWRAPMEAVREAMAHQDVDLPVRCAYLELCEPSLPTVIGEMHAAGVRSFSIVPMFLGTGRHAREDLPELVAALRTAHADIHIDLQQAIGEDPRMTALMAEIASEG